MITVKVHPPGQTEVGWRMKPGDAVQVDWPGEHEMLISVDETGVLKISGSAKSTED